MANIAEKRGCVYLSVRHKRNFDKTSWGAVKIFETEQKLQGNIEKIKKFR